MVKLPRNSDLLTIPQAAGRLKTTRQNVHDAITRGRLPATCIGRMLLVQRSDLDAYGKSRKRTGRPPLKKHK
jgi:excisionase family DNA binding protein